MTASDNASLWKSAAERKEERDQKREAVLRTAARLFLDRGVHRTTMSDVAERLNITKPALYHYFKNKNDILFECYRLGAELTESELNDAESSCASGIEKLRTFIRVYVTVLTIDLGTCVILLDDRDLADEQRAQIYHWRWSIHQRLKRYIDEGVRDGSIAPCDTSIVAHAISGALNGIGYWYRPDGRLTSAAIAERMAAYLTKPLETTDRTAAPAQSNATGQTE